MRPWLAGMIFLNALDALNAATSALAGAPPKPADPKAPPSAEMLLELDLLSDDDFDSHSRAEARSGKDDVDRVDEFEWPDSEERTSGGRRRQ